MDNTGSNNSNLIEEKEVETLPTLSAYLREKGTKLFKEGEEAKLYPQEKIAEKLNISRDQLRKKIYNPRLLTRDWLIAICAAYGLKESETSDALRICNFPTIDDNSPRERFFLDFLDEHQFESISVDTFNSALTAAKLPPLDISYRKKKSPFSLMGEKNTSPYKKIGPTKIKIFEDEGDPYNSLATRYEPRYRCVAAILLEDSDKKRYIFKVFSDGKVFFTEERADFPMQIEIPKQASPLYEYYVDLAGHVRKEKQRLDDVCNDTKNYKNRISANIKNQRIHVFYEEFNYAMPERNEYLLMEYVDGRYALSVARKSMFMQEYLSEEDYYRLYHTKEKIDRRTYYSAEEIEEVFKKNKVSHFYPDLLNYRIKAYQRLKTIVDDTIGAIRKRDLFVLNTDDIFATPYEIISYYNVEKEFNCTYDEEGFIETDSESAVFTDENGNSTIVTFPELERSFELGISSIQEICNIKRMYGDIEKILL